MSDHDDIRLEPKGGPNDHWHVAERHEDEDGGVYFEIINYARHERIYVHDCTTGRADALAKKLNAAAY